jgi:hypothetical protein
VEVLPLTLHSPHFISFDPNSSDDANISPETNPFQAVVKLNKDVDNMKIKVTLDNSKSVFRPRRLVFQCAFFNDDIYDGAIAAATSAAASQSVDEAPSSSTPTKFLDSLPAKVIGGLLIGGAASGGIGALAGGMVVVGGLKGIEYMKGKDENDVKDKDDKGPRTVDSQPTPSSASMTPPSPELVDSLSSEISNLQTDLSRFEEERRGWEVEKVSLRQAASEAVTKLSSLRKSIAIERKLGHRREEELVRSVVELEGTVRRLKREKKLLVTEVRRVTDEKERVLFELRSEIDEKNINLRVAERRIRKLSGEEESDSKKSAEKAEATAKVNAQLTQLRSKLKTLHDRKAR